MLLGTSLRAYEERYLIFTRTTEQIFDYSPPAIDCVLQGKLPAKEALTVISREWQKVIKSSKREALQEQWHSLKIN